MAIAAKHIPRINVDKLWLDEFDHLNWEAEIKKMSKSKAEEDADVLAWNAKARADEHLLNGPGGGADKATVPSNPPSFAGHGNEEIDALKKQVEDQTQEIARLQQRLRDAELKANSDGW